MTRSLRGSLIQHEAAREGRRFIRLPGERQGGARRPLWVRVTAAVMAVVMYFAPVLLQLEEAAYAAPIVDPRAPVTFQPAITQTSTGIPAVNIAAPNASGISANQYSSFNVDSTGLVLNNSLVPGTPLLGGTLGANPNLNGRAATTILNQVTSTAPSTLAGPLEVFGSPANIIISNANGISVNGLSLTNAPGLVLTTGVPQFITGVGGTATSFDNAGALAYQVSSGNITINGPTGVNGPGAGIEGTVGNIDLIGQSVNLNAPLYADNTFNIITGNQTVTPTVASASGTTYSTSNVVAGQPGAMAVDASQYGSVTAGEIYIVSTAAGQGVNMQGALAATAGNVVVNANGDIAVGQTFASQNVALAGAGNVAITGTGLANQNYTVSTAGDINATGSVSAGQEATLTAGGDLDATSVAANGSTALTSGDSMTVGSVSGQNLALRTGTGDLTINSAVTAPGTISASAGRDLTVNGAVQGGSAVALTGARNASINGSVSGVGDTTLTAQTGSASVASNVQTNGALNATGAQDVVLGGTVQAQGPVSITAADGSITGQGNVISSTGTVSLTAGQNIQTGGSLQAGTDLSVNAGVDATLGGTVTAPGAITVTAGQDATLAGDVTAGSTLTVAAGNSASLDGTVASVDDMTLSAAAGTLTTTGDVVSLGTLIVDGQLGVNLGDTVYGSGNTTIGSVAGAVAVAGSLTSPGSITVNAAQDALISGVVHSGNDTTVSAGGSVALDGGLEADGTGNATVSAGGSITGSGAINVANNTALVAGSSIDLGGAIQTGNDLTATAAQDVAMGAVTAVDNATITATNGSATLGGDVLTGGNLAVTAGTDVNAPGSVQSLGSLNLNAQGGNLTASGPVSSAGNATLNAGQTLALNGQTTVQGNAALTGGNIATRALTVGGNLSANAAQNLNTSAGELAVNGTATLAGARVTTGDAIVAGAYSATGTQGLTATGTGAYLGNTTLAGGTVTTSGTQMAAGSLNVSGSTVTNSGALSGLAVTNITATDLFNSGTVYGPVTNVSVTNSTTNSGALMATNALTLTTNSLENAGGTIFAGDTSQNPNLSLGDVTVNVNGPDGSFDNTNGSILGIDSATLNLRNQTVDPSSSAFGTVNGGNTLNLSVATLNNTGAWAVPATTVHVTAAQVSNAGTITQAGGTLALNGAVSNTGTITAQDLTVNGSLANAAGATVQGNDTFMLNGSGTNAGTVEALNQLAISGTSYDNSNGTTKVGTSTAGTGNMSIDLSGNLTNSNGFLTATNNLTIQADNVINTAAGGTGTTTTTTTTVVNVPLLMSTVIGTETIYGLQNDGSPDGNLSVVSQSVPVTIGDILSPEGVVPDSDIIDGVNAQQEQPVATSGTVQFLEYLTGQASGSNANMWYLDSPLVSFGESPTSTLTLTIPSVTETTTTTSGSPGNSVIAAGGNLNLTATSLQNTGGTVSAGNDANINVQSLSNGALSASSTVTDTVDSAALTAFMNALQSMQGSGGITVYGSGNPTGISCNGSDSCADGPPTPYSSFSFDTPGNVAVQSVTSSVTVPGQAGQIVAGHNVNLSGGGLTNGGTITGGNDVNISAASFTNQGANTGTMTTTVGCAAGYSAGCSSLTTTNPDSETYAYQQINANVTAGNDIVIAASTVNNTYGNLVAGRNVVIGGPGTTASDASTTPANLTQATTVTNTSGAIEAGNDVDINAATLTNTIAAPVQIHQNYGSATPFTGCSSNCEAYVDVQSADPATITANHDVNLTAGTFSNTGSLVTALNNVTINATAGASSDNQLLSAYWHANLTYYDASFPAWGCANDPSLCATLYGSSYVAAQAQDPGGLPDAVGLPDFVPATIQAGNSLSVNSPTLTNTGNVIGQNVALTGSTLVNGLTNPNVYTPPPAVSGQVITLGPPSVPSRATTTVNAAGLVTNLNGQPVSVTGTASQPSNAPVGVTTVGTPTAPIVAGVGGPATSTVKTVSGQTITVSYLLNSPASAVSGDLSPSALLAALPAGLQPDTTQFYYDPYTQTQQVEQAALEATGQSSFYALPSQTDATNQSTLNNLDTAALYGAALQYAEQNNVALGTQLSQQQLALVNAPMLWYVEETVPEPGCTATGSGACPTVQALMPEVLLPPDYASVQADGTITGTNVTLNYASSILNTGTVSADNLTVETASLTNEQRSTNVGTIYQDVSDGVAATTGTVVQAGGLMEAANYDLQVQSLNQIGGALEQLNADGTKNTAATQQLLSNLQAQLGSGFTQSAVSNDLTTSMVYTDSGFDFLSILGMVAAVVLSYELGPEMMSVFSGLIDPIALAATSSTLAVVGSAAATGLGIGTTALMASVADQLISTGSIDLGSAFENAGVAALTAGLTQGLLGATGISNLGNGITHANSSITLANLGTTAENVVGQSLITAGVENLIGRGSFGTDLLDSFAQDAESVANNLIGNLADDASPENVAAHAALGCAVGAATGTGCGGGAIGGAASAALTPLVASAITGGNPNVTTGQQAAIAAFATFAGGTLAGLAGQNVAAGALAAQNEAINNCLGHPETPVRRC